MGVVFLLTSLNAGAFSLKFWEDDEPVAEKRTPALNSGQSPAMPRQRMGIQPPQPMGPDSFPPMMGGMPGEMPSPPPPPIDNYTGAAASIPLPPSPPSYAPPQPVAQGAYPQVPLPAGRRPPAFNQQAVGSKDLPLASPANEVIARPLPGGEIVSAPPPPAGIDPLVPVQRSTAVTRPPLASAPESFPLPRPGEVDEHGYPRLSAMPVAPRPPVSAAQDPRVAELRQDYNNIAAQGYGNAGPAQKIVVRNPVTELPPQSAASTNFADLRPLTSSAPDQIQPLAVAPVPPAPLPPAAPQIPQYQHYQPPVNIAAPQQTLMPEGPTVVVRSKHSGAPSSSHQAYTPPPAPPVARYNPQYNPAPLAQAPAYAPAPLSYSPDSVPIPPRPQAMVQRGNPPSYLNTGHSQSAPVHVAPIVPAVSPSDTPSTSLSQLRPLGVSPSVGSKNYGSTTIAPSRYAKKRAEARRAYEE